MPKPPLTIWTIGHSTHPIGDFLELLRGQKIQTLVDVRHFPGSRAFPQFNQVRLARSLTRAGIRYEHIIELGGRRRASKDSHNLVWRNASFRGYADYMETPAFADGFERLLKIARRSRTAIMCSEAVWWRCHRSMISDLLKSKGIRVLHILSATKIQEHPYTSAARIVRGRLSYRSPAAATKERTTMKRDFKVGDHVEWNSEAGRVRGTIQKRVTREFQFKGYTHHASKDEPQYLIKSDKTDHVAMHKGSALKKIAKSSKRAAATKKTSKRKG